MRIRLHLDGGYAKSACDENSVAGVIEMYSAQEEVLAISMNEGGSDFHPVWSRESGCNQENLNLLGVGWVTKYVK